MNIQPRCLKSILPSITILVALTFSSPLIAQDKNGLARDYLVQKVCISSDGKVLQTDPYHCESPNRLRNLQVGEDLPYHKTDQKNAQRHDSYPVMAPNGVEIYVNPFDFAPFGVFNLWGDGYDIYQIRDGWVSASDTKDGGGFSTTFFGEGCKPYNGWSFFPTSALSANGLTNGSANIPIAGRYWEQNGEAWPGKCPTAYGKGSLTTWEFIKGFQFGGTSPDSIKTIDTIRVVHGLENTPTFAQKGHLEIFYFTQLYGVTRWEVWVVSGAQQGGAAANGPVCSGPADDISYQGMHFKRTQCRDWTVISPSSSSEPNTMWPVPELNLLKNFHFADATSNWNRTGKSSDGNSMNWSLRNSTQDKDIHFHQDTGQGVRYIAVNCGGDCTEGEQLYQDVPVTGSMGGADTYAVGATVKTEGGPGDIEIGLIQLDSSGKVLSTAKFPVTVSEKNERESAQGSVVLSSTYITSNAPIPLESGAKTLRFYLSPKSKTTFDVVDTWLMKRQPK
jgi:hypothetical protein